MIVGVWFYKEGLLLVFEEILIGNQTAFAYWIEMWWVFRLGDVEENKSSSFVDSF